MATSFSRPAGRKKSPQGATGPSTLNVSKEDPTPANDNTQRFKMARNCQLVGQNRKQLGNLSTDQILYLWEKGFLWTLICSCDFLTDKQGNKPPMGKEFFGFEPDAFLKSAMLILE
ncbi:hypothetical protein AVEN_134696-1 [Araneus ventricosus]|uniref:Uncharacterized protein n=1 Tax=Araneus ventricosus TaxID=182803 RepID=A0A4Y2HW49_ARAVE|nr:hypothetical protein AVEN_134696-1 [Araneus ventricosus]